MGKWLRWAFNIAGLGVGVFFIWSRAMGLFNPPHAVPVPAGASQDAAGLTFSRLLEAAEQSLLYLTLVLFPVMYLLGKLIWHKLYSALAVLLFAGLCVLFAQTLHASIIDGYVFFLAQSKHWDELVRPAAIFIVVMANWFMAFVEMYTVVKVAGK